jgi:Winged helix DNA-binding domain
LTTRALNRALLARQLLLERDASLSPLRAVDHLVGLQAQAPLPPYLALWSRLAGFDPASLGALIEGRSAVRLTLMRGTVHLVSARDALWLRPLMQPMIEQRFLGTWRRQFGEVDTAALESAARALLDERGPLTARELATELLVRGIGSDLEAVTNATRVYAPLVQVPPRGVWGKGGRARYATLEAWTGQPLADEPSLDELVLRYLRAFGPASVMDLQNWSGLTRCGGAFERLRPELVTFASEDGRELFDLPDAPRPPEDAEAPPRFLGEFDNVLLGHADRRRIVPDGFALPARGRAYNHLLVDGMLRALWWVDGDALVISASPPLSPAERAAVEAEAEGLLALLSLRAVVRAS